LTSGGGSRCVAPCLGALPPPRALAADDEDGEEEGEEGFARDWRNLAMAGSDSGFPSNARSSVSGGYITALLEGSATTTATEDVLPFSTSPLLTAAAAATAVATGAGAGGRFVVVF